MAAMTAAVAQQQYGGLHGLDPNSVFASLANMPHSGAPGAGFDLSQAAFSAAAVAAAAAAGVVPPPPPAPAPPGLPAGGPLPETPVTSALSTPPSSAITNAIEPTRLHSPQTIANASSPAQPARASSALAFSDAKRQRVEIVSFYFSLNLHVSIYRPPKLLVSCGETEIHLLRMFRKSEIGFSLCVCVCGSVVVFPLLLLLIILLPTPSTKCKCADRMASFLATSWPLYVCVRVRERESLNRSPQCGRLVLLIALSVCLLSHFCLPPLIVHVQRVKHVLTQ